MGCLGLDRPKEKTFRGDIWSEEGTLWRIGWKGWIALGLSQSCLSKEGLSPSWRSLLGEATIPSTLNALQQLSMPH